MKAVVQDLRSGKTRLTELPAPALGHGEVLCENRASLISAGTERMLAAFGRASLLEKARQQPDKVAAVLQKAKVDGIAATFDAVRSKLDQPLALGYSSASIVKDIGPRVRDFRPGDRVVSNGPHAELFAVPQNLCAKIPDGVDDESAAFTVIASIGLQGIRLASPTLGESFVVVGLGLIGLLTVQLLRAHGCEVIGIDFDSEKLALAHRFGAETVDLSSGEDAVAAGLHFSGGRGVDGVIVTASTKSSDPITHAARMCRKRGRIVLVGVTGLELNRADFYEKELTFQVSCSYGPGRYDPQYEEKGHDYPLGFVRWTAQRNFEAILSMMADGRLDVRPLISHRFPFDNASEAYDVLTTESATLGILLQYAKQPEGRPFPRHIALAGSQRVYGQREVVLGLIGAGNYASRVLIPALKRTGARLDTIVAGGGVNAVHQGRKAGFASASTDPRDVLASKAINTIVVATRHDSHAQYAVDALSASKHVFVEKPLALTAGDLAAVESAYRDASLSSSSVLLMVGFNRRFSPLVVRMKALLDTVRGPKAFVYTCNAGAIPGEHWTQDPEVGGGRILGEACHFIDLVRHLAGHPIVEHAIATMGTGAQQVRSDKAIITLRFADGSIATIQYLANGGKAFPKERLEVFAGNAVLALENFRLLRGYGWPAFSTMRLWRQDKGQHACMAAFVDAVTNGKVSPIAFDELVEVSQVSIRLAEAQRRFQ